MAKYLKKEEKEGEAEEEGKKENEKEVKDMEKEGEGNPLEKPGGALTGHFTKVSLETHLCSNDFLQEATSSCWFESRMALQQAWCSLNMYVGCLPFTGL